jgi:ribosomal protein S18 acetylase RimI-like enzyme
VQIRPATEDDFEPLGRLTVAAYRTLDRPPSAEYSATLADVAARVREADILVAVDEHGELLGGVTYVGDAASRFAEFDAPDEACFRMLAVDPAARARGIGGALVAACISRARSDGKRALTLYTTDHMAGAQRLYRRFGFQPAPERDMIVESGLMLRSFVLELNENRH